MTFTGWFFVGCIVGFLAGVAVCAVFTSGLVGYALDKLAESEKKVKELRKRFGD